MSSGGVYLKKFDSPGESRVDLTAAQSDRGSFPKQKTCTTLVKILTFVVFLALAIAVAACVAAVIIVHKQDDTCAHLSGDNLTDLEPSFSSGVSQGIVTALEEGSGLAASRKHPGILYTHNDRGGKNRIFAIDAKTAQHRATFTISGATNNDWEDVCVGTCGSDTCLYIGDIGDGAPATKTVYRVKEPAAMSDQSLPVDSKLLFKWNQADCETLMIDTSEEIYIASKTDDEPSYFAHVPSAGNWGTGQAVNVQATVKFPFYTTKKNPVGGDISPNGKEMLIKFKEWVLYYKLNSGETYEHAVTRDPVKLPYTIEPRGESVCWSSNADGYYTMSENEGKPRPLLYYRRQ